MDKQTQKTLFSSNKEDWETPQDLFNKLNDIFHFTLDAAASDQNYKCNRHCTKENSGLDMCWMGDRVWCNPPYGRKAGMFLRKAANEACLNVFSCFLVAARTDVKWMHDWVLPSASALFLFRGRLNFEIDGKSVLDKNGRPVGAPFPSMLVIYNATFLELNNVVIFLDKRFNMGKLVELKGAKR